MKKLVSLFVFFLFIFLEAKSQHNIAAKEDCVEVIKARYIQALTGIDQKKEMYLNLLAAFPFETEISDQNIVELYQLFPVEEKEVKAWGSVFQEDGSWKDINYQDTKRSGWEPKIHAERILRMTRWYYCKKKDLSKSALDSLTGVIHKAMNFWFNRKFSCQNWWYNQIGVPRTLGPAFLLFEQEMTPEEKERAVREMKYSKFGMTGQNKVWLAGNVLIRALLEKDNTLLKAARDTIVAEITMGKKEGIQSDWSFHQHGPQQQWGNYGLSFLCNMCAYSDLFANTPLALSVEQNELLFSFFKQGYQWIVWKGYWDVNALNRQLFHNADIHKSFMLLFAAYALARAGTPEQAQLVEQFIQSNFLSSGEVNPWVGHKVFWDSDQTIHRTPTWMASVKMASNRVIGTELVNEDNKQGYYLADGAMFVYSRGDEYHNIFPFWDWRKIPGITCYESKEAIPTCYGEGARNYSDFVGGVTDGQTGITAMILNRDGLQARKSWIFTDKFAFCMGCRIRGQQNRPLTTSIEQSVFADTLFMLKEREWMALKTPYQGKEKDLRFYHRNTGYIVLYGDTCVAGVEERTGRWFDVMGMYRPATLKKEIFQLYIKHRSGKDGIYEYFVLPASTLQQVRDFDPKQVKVICNNDLLQVVVIGNVCYLVAYQPGNYTLPQLGNISIGKPGFFLVRKEEKEMQVCAASPVHAKDTLTLGIWGKEIKLLTNEYGYAQTIK